MTAADRGRPAGRQGEAKREYVAGLLFHGDEVALVRKARPEWQAGRYNGIGGHIEAGEAPLTAMVREFTEETGVHLIGWQHFATLRGGGGKDAGAWVVHWFRASVAEQLPLQGEPDEPVAWYSVHELPEVIPNVRWLIEMASLSQRHDWPLTIVESDDALLGPPRAAAGEPARQEAPLDLAAIRSAVRARFDRDVSHLAQESAAFGDDLTLSGRVVRQWIGNALMIEVATRAAVAASPGGTGAETDR